MDKNYVKALNIAEDALSRINSLYEKASIESFEDRKVCKGTEKLLEDLDDFIKTIKHYNKTTQEGYLFFNSKNRYSLGNVELTCGTSVEVYNEKYQEWESGVVEHSSKYGGYYFLNYDNENISLSENMKARIRK